MRESVIFTAVSQRIGTRAYQQDQCFAATDESGHRALGIVCDGMGGMESGDRASKMALELFVEDYDDLEENTIDYYDFFLKEMTAIDRQVAELRGQDGRKLKTGTTLVAASISEGLLQWVSVGDSRIFVVRDGEMTSVVREHNYRMLLDYRLKSGAITKEEYMKESVYGAGLISYIGMGNVNLIDANREPVKLQDRDLVILCSDGLTDALSEDKILSVIRENPDNPGYINKRLQDEAGYASQRGQDNTTIVIMLYRLI